MGNSGKGLGIVALIIAIGALGLGVYPIILPSPSEGPKIYVATYDDTFDLDFNTYRLIPQLNVTYNTKAGDLVLIEFSCHIRLDPIGTSTIILYFELDEGYASSYIDLTADQDIKTTGIMKHYIQYSTAGEHMVQILTYIDEEYTYSYVRFSVLTVTVF